MFLCLGSTCDNLLIICCVSRDLTNSTILSLYLLQALALLRKDENNVVNIEEAIDFVNNQLSTDESEGSSSVQQTQASQDQRLPSTPNPSSSTQHADDSHVNPLDQNDLQVPSELVSRCMATLLMIQVTISNNPFCLLTQIHY